MNAETVTFTKTVAIADADHKPICEGSVLRHVKDGVVGVVDRIIRPTDKFGPFFAQVGDILIRTSPGTHRGTNRYTDWKHVPHSEQTYAQRYLSWLLRKETAEEYAQEEGSHMTEDEARVVAGIMHLLPDDAVDWDYGPFPDTIEDALKILSSHLSKLSKQED